MNSGSTVLDLELRRVTLLGPGISVRDDDIGSTEFLCDCIRDDLLRFVWLDPSVLSILLRATSGDAELDEDSGISSSSSEGSKSPSESTVAHDAVSCGFDRFVTRAIICDGFLSLFSISKRLYICSRESSLGVWCLLTVVGVGTFSSAGWERLKRQRREFTRDYKHTGLLKRLRGGWHGVLFKRLASSNNSTQATL